jgi:hypothetical protein
VGGLGRSLIGFLPDMPALVAVIGGLWGIRRIRKPDIRARADRPIGIRLAWAAAVLGGLVISAVAASIGVMFSEGNFNLLLGLPFGIAAGVLFGLAAVFGYALLARTRLGGIAAAGSLLGPVLLLGGTMLVNGAAARLSQAQFDADVAANDAAVAARSSVLHVAIESIDVKTAQGGAVIAAVHLRLRLSTDIALEFPPSNRGPEPAFYLEPPDPYGAVALTAAAPPGSPASIAAGGFAIYSLDFQYTDELIHATTGTYRAGPPGAWVLGVFFGQPTTSGEYNVELPLTLR